MAWSTGAPSASVRPLVKTTVPEEMLGSHSETDGAERLHLRAIRRIRTRSEGRIESLAARQIASQARRKSPDSKGSGSDH